MDRRTTLRTLVAAGAVSVTGCTALREDDGASSADDTSDGNGDDTADGNDDETPSPNGNGTPGIDATFHVSPDGDDANDGTGVEAPFATIDRAREAVRERLADGESEPITVALRGGRYERDGPIELGPEDSGTEDAPISYLAYPGETPVIDGSEAIEGWEETTIDGRTAWKTTIDEVAAGGAYFRQLFVDGERRPRPRLPKSVNDVLEDGALVSEDESEFHHYVDAADGGEAGDARTFTAAEGSVDPDWHNLGDVDVVSMAGWYAERMPIESVTGDEVTVAFRPYPGSWIDWHDRTYYVENVFEALAEPGEWYLDRETGECWYLPRAGETIDDVRIAAPRTRHLLVVAGEPDDPVEYVGFEGVTFARSGWEHFESVDWITSQSAAPTDGAIVFREARDCGLIDCTVRAVGEYGLSIEEGCRRIDVIGCEVADAGSGGIKVGSYVAKPGVNEARTGDNRLVDNRIHDVGAVFHMGAGVLALDADGNEIAHNEIRDCYYTGVSCGYSWGFHDSVADDNRIAYNHIHDLGSRLLSDMGGIYTLGVQPNTVVRNNYVHDVHQNEYGGWGLYPDEGSTGLLWADNVVHDCETPVHLHYGADNRFRNNVLADGREALVAYTNPDTGGVSDYGLRFEGNVFVANGTPTFATYGAIAAGTPTLGDLYEAIESDRNCFWDRSGDPVVALGVAGANADEALDLSTWRAETGRDEESIVADPGLDAEYALAADSPALDPPVAFDPIDLGAVGPRDDPPEARYRQG